jgi:hypothetical protein
VSPSAQRQRLGLHLMCRSLALVSRSIGDLAALSPEQIPNELASPSCVVGTPDRAGKGGRDPEVPRRLVEYYADGGFEVDEEYGKETGGVWMCVAFQAQPTPDEYWSIVRSPESMPAPES